MSCDANNLYWDANKWGKAYTRGIANMSNYSLMEIIVVVYFCIQQHVLPSQQQEQVFTQNQHVLLN